MLQLHSKGHNVNLYPCSSCLVSLRKHLSTNFFLSCASFYCCSFNQIIVHSCTDFRRSCFESELFMLVNKTLLIAKEDMTTRSNYQSIFLPSAISGFSIDSMAYEFLLLIASINKNTFLKTKKRTHCLTHKLLS